MSAYFLAAAAAAASGDDASDCATMFPRPAAETIKRADTCCWSLQPPARRCSHALAGHRDASTDISC